MWGRLLQFINICCSFSIQLYFPHLFDVRLNLVTLSGIEMWQVTCYLGRNFKSQSELTMALNPLPQDKQRPRQRLLSDGVLQRRTQGTGQDGHIARTKPTSLVFTPRKFSLFWLIQNIKQFLYCLFKFLHGSQLLRLQTKNKTKQKTPKPPTGAYMNIRNSPSLLWQLHCQAPSYTLWTL